MARAAIAQRENLIVRSDAMGNASWTKVNVTVPTVTVTGPAVLGSPGVSEALVPDTSNAAHAVLQTFAAADLSEVYTASIFAKKGTFNFLLLSNNGGSSGAWFNLNTGAVGTALATTARMFDAGSGWYLCTVTSALSAAGGVAGQHVAWVTNADATVAFVGNGTEGIYVVRAQVTKANWHGPPQLTTGAAVTGPLRNLAVYS